MRSKQFLTLLWIFILLALSGSASAQKSRRNFTRPQTYDVEHYVIRVGFDRPAKKVIGDTTIRFKPLGNGLKSAEFDAVGISFSSVTLEPAGTKLKFLASADKITVTLDKTY